MRTALISFLLCVGLAKAQSSPQGGAPALRSVRLITADNRALPAQKSLNATLNQHLGKAIDDTELGVLADLVVDHLHRHHWPVSVVTVWDEDDGLAKGDVTLQVQQGKIGDIAVVGGSKRRQLAVAKKVANLYGQPLNSLTLQRRLDALSFSPWLAATASASPGGSFDTANLTLTLRDQNPIQVFASYENNGIEPLGENRYTLGIEWLNAFALGQDLIFTTSIADDPHTLTAYAASWRIPLPWRHELRLSGYYSESNSIADVLGIPLEFGGISWEIGTRYVIPWRLNDHWRSEWSLGFDYKQFNTDFTFGGTAVLGDTTGVGSLVVGTQWFYDTAQNHARIGLEVDHGEPGWAKGQDEDQFGELVPGASPRFTILRGDATFEHDFKNDTQASLRLGGQWSDGPLLPSEELGLASVNTVRGYPERSVRASRGAWASLEARSPAWHKFRAIAFADGGLNADEAKDTTYLASAGIGLRGEITQHFQLRAELAFPLINGDEPRVHLAAVLRF